MRSVVNVSDPSVSTSAATSTREAETRTSFWKQLAYMLALAVTSPLWLCERLARKAAGRDVWFASHGEFLSLLPGKVGYFLRNAYYHLTLKSCPLNCCFLFGTTFTHSGSEVGERVYIGARCMLGLVAIGSDTMLGDNVQVLSGRYQHSFGDAQSRLQDQKQTFTRIEIGENSWIGTSATLMANVGKHSVIGAGSVVVRNIGDDSVAVGNPARVIRSTRPSSILR